MVNITPDIFADWVKQFDGYVNARWCEKNRDLIQEAIDESLVTLISNWVVTEDGQRCWYFKLGSEGVSKSAKDTTSDRATFLQSEEGMVMIDFEITDPRGQVVLDGVAKTPLGAIRKFAEFSSYTGTDNWGWWLEQFKSGYRLGRKTTIEPPPPPCNPEEAW